MNHVTLKDVALEAGVDASTASRALDPGRQHLVADATRLKIQRAAAKLGYVRDERARALRRGRTDTVGVIVADLTNPFAGDVIRGIESVLDGHRMTALIAETQDEPERLHGVVAHLLQRRVDGLINTAATFENTDLIAETNSRLPVVLALRYLPGVEIPAVVFDEQYGASLVARHFASQGHVRVAQICGPRGVSTFSDRETGFADECERLGLELLKLDLHSTHPTIQEGRQLMAQLLGEDLPHGVFVHNDFMAIGALQSIRETGLRCPEDIALVGYDDILVSEHTRPPLSTVRVPSFQLGRSAADLLLSLLLSNVEVPTRISLSPTFVERESSRPAKGPV